LYDQLQLAAPRNGASHAALSLDHILVDVQAGILDPQRASELLSQVLPNSAPEERG